MKGSVQLGAGRHLQRIPLEEGTNALHIGLRLMMDRLVQQLSGKVTQQDGFGGLPGLDLVQQMDQRGGGIAFETGCYGGDIHQQIGFVDEQFRIVDALFDPWFDQIQLCTRMKPFQQVAPIS